jgi:fatty acid desaturase
LEPRWAAVWFDLAARYALLALGYAAACGVAAAAGNLIGLALAPLTGVWMGFWFASIVLFMHEAAHYNLHPDKKRNDRIAQWLVCILIGDEIRRYRAVHWEHHLHLGQPEDTEVSYHFAPTLRCALENLVGVHVWRVFKEHHLGRDTGGDIAAAPARGWLALASGVALHALLLTATVAAGWYSAAVAWVFAVGVCFPFFSALRNQLEHRSVDALPGVDYRRTPHGAVNRMFERSPFARAFGSTGFRRHLLHHWDPQISYSRFDELERFLMQTEAAAEIDEARTSYLSIWRTLARRPSESRAGVQVPAN